jgi:alkanesulfonate monooxygenase SsuD/methylene tetrahydromethanopterin reductase-like flavin-dependent oxidoreductase (luciferase family)
MIVDNDGRVSGSIDVSQLAALHADTNDEDLRAHYQQVAAENGIALDDVPQPAPAEAADEGDYADWSLAELQAEAEARGVAKSGNKADIADRLREYDASPPEE